LPAKRLAATILTGGRARVPTAGDLDPEVRMQFDPELAAALSAMPNLHIQDLPAARGRMRELAARAVLPDAPEVTVVDHSVPGVDGEPPVTVRVATPPRSAGSVPAVLVLHGGGFVMGDLDGTTAGIMALCHGLGVVVVAVGYRLAPEHPYPAALNDCLAALRWTVDEAAELGVDPARVALYGMSAGGCLAAAITLFVRNRGGPPVCFQVLDAPVIDDRLTSPSMQRFVDTPLWSRPDAELSWAHYLGARDGDVPVYAAPARAADLSGLPPAYVSVYEYDPLRDEGIAYATRLLDAGVPVELHLFPGTFHRSVVIGSAAVSRRQAAETLDALRRGLAVD
jgi:acetyl esterase/lipase